MPPEARLRGAALAIVSCALLAGAPAALAGEWEFSQRIRGGAYWTDNVTAAPEGEEDSDWIASLEPGLSLDYLGPRGNASLNYDAQALWYQDNDEFDDVFHQFFGNGQLIVTPDTLFLDGFARYGQANIDPAGRVAQGNIIQTGNLTDAAIYGASPWYTDRYGQWGEALARYTYQAVRYRNTDETTTSVQDSDSNIMFASLGSQSGAPGLSWRSSVNYQLTEYDLSPDFEYGEATQEFGYPVGLRTRGIVTVGMESDFIEDQSQGGFDEFFWTVGFSWEPNERESLSASAGERFYGNTYAFNWQRRAARGEVSVSYVEEATTSNLRLFGDGSDPIGGQPGLPTLDPAVFLSKRLSGSARYDLTRTRLTARLYGERREFVEADSRPDEDVAGLDLTADWDVAPRTRLDTLLRYEYRDFGGSRSSSDTYEVTLGVRRDITRTAFASFRVGHYRRDFETSGDYDINWASITFGMDFQ